MRSGSLLVISFIGLIISNTGDSPCFISRPPYIHCLVSISNLTGHKQKQGVPPPPPQSAPPAVSSLALQCHICPGEHLGVIPHPSLLLLRPGSSLKRECGNDHLHCRHPACEPSHPGLLPGLLPPSLLLQSCFHSALIMLFSTQQPESLKKR